MLRGIGARLLVSYLLLIVVAMGLLCPYFLHAFRQFHLEWAANDLRARAMAISDTIVHLMLSEGREERLKSVTSQFRRQDRVLVRILDEKGQVLGSTAPEEARRAPASSTCPEFALACGGSITPAGRSAAPPPPSASTWSSRSEMRAACWAWCASHSFLATSRPRTAACGTWHSARC